MTLAAAAERCGIVPDDLQAWMAEPETEDALAGDMKASRTPSPAALALVHKLADDGDGGHRYPCPSYELKRTDGATLTAPGFQPLAAYEVAVANLIPGAERRPDLTEVTEVLTWPGEPLATARGRNRVRDLAPAGPRAPGQGGRRGARRL